LVIGKQFEFEREQDNLIERIELSVEELDDIVSLGGFIEYFNSIEFVQDINTVLGEFEEFNNIVELGGTEEYIELCLMFAYNSLVVDINIFDQ
jgi:hypothetical protein